MRLPADTPVLHIVPFEAYDYLTTTFIDEHVFCNTFIGNIIKYKLDKYTSNKNIATGNL